jgi:hypothetical protein
LDDTHLPLLLWYVARRWMFLFSSFLVRCAAVFWSRLLKFKNIACP